MESVNVACGHVDQITCPAGATPPGPGITTAVPTNSDWTRLVSPFASVQAVIVGTGAVTATVLVQVSNGPPGALPGGTENLQPVATSVVSLSLTGTTTASDGVSLAGKAWKWVRISVTAISGTNATVTAYLGT